MFAAEPPQEPLPYGRWGDALGEHFEKAAETGIGDITWFPDRTCRPHLRARDRAGRGRRRGVRLRVLHARARGRSGHGLHGGRGLHGRDGRRGVVTLVWGVALVANGVAATAELGPTTTDQCTLVEDRFTLVSLDAYTGDYVEVRLFGARGAELARESLYEDE